MLLEENVKGLQWLILSLIFAVKEILIKKYFTKKELIRHLIVAFIKISVKNAHLKHLLSV